MTGGISALVAAVTHEATLFAAIGLFVGGIDDLAVDATYFFHALRRRTRPATPTLAGLPDPVGRYAMLVAAWDEAAVIGGMLTTASAALRSPDLRIYVGTYPNDPATIEAVARVAEQDPRIRLVIGNRAGPTTKADCLNAVWRALVADERHEGRAFDAIILHDAEDVVHRGELQAYEHALRDVDAVQLPVHPIARPGAHLVGGTYLDEFAEAHQKQLVARGAVGAGIPLAGVGCAIRRATIGRIAEARGGLPFDATTLTEDYELGLTIATTGGRTTLALYPEAPGAPPIAVRAYFPATIEAAVRQKTRWLIGIALAGWDRVGWDRAHRFGEHWWRMRDRRAPLAMLVLVSAYLALIGWTATYVGSLLGGPAPRVPQGWTALLLALNGGLLLWRMAMRATFVGRLYGTAEALRSLPRMLVGNIVAMMAAWRALLRYGLMLRGAPLRWDKTAHQFPAEAADA